MIVDRDCWGGNPKGVSPLLRRRFARVFNGRVETQPRQNQRSNDPEVREKVEGLVLREIGHRGTGSVIQRVTE